MSWINAHHEDTPRGRVTTVEINNEAKRNAVNVEVALELRQVFEELAVDPDLRAVILRGAGDKAFIAGADINVMQNLASPDEARAFITSLHLAIKAIRELPVPTIARLSGACFGAGLEIAAGCDMRIGDESTVIGMPEVKVGIPSVIEAALLPGLIGGGRTREMLLTGMNYSAQEALSMNFLQRLVSHDRLDATIQDHINHILESGPRAVRAQKALINKWTGLDLEDAIQAGIEHFAEAYETDEPQTYMAPHLARRKNKKEMT